MDLFINKEFTKEKADFENFNWEEAKVKYKSYDSIYTYEGKKDFSHITLGMFNNNKTFMVRMVNETKDQHYFLFVFDEEMERVYVNHLISGKQILRLSEINQEKRVRVFLENIEISYRKKRGENAYTKEELVIEEIAAVFALEGNGKRYAVEVETRNKIVNRDRQVFTLSNRGTRARWRKLYEELGIPRADLKRGVIYHPDILVQMEDVNVRGRQKYMFLELELSRHPKQDFFIKLMKAKRKQSGLYFVFSDAHAQYHYDLVEEFIRTYGKFNLIRYCTVSEFFDYSGNNIKEVFRDF
ncbi:MAG: hypothetical protein ACQEUT_18340 [Bacillota bacterium]